MHPLLETARLRLRQWVSADREPFAALNGDPGVMEYFPALLSPRESATFAERIEAHIAAQGWGLWAVEIPGITPFAGYIGLARPRFQAHFTPCVEVGWRLAAEFWGKGYASEGAAAALRFGFQELQLPEIVSFTVPSNRRSWRVMERIGMIRDARDDFEHPGLPEGHPLRPHVLYRKAAPAR
jgi:RimJ/RimL family protein N-acetyltransferase